jgi:hypothetical protein
MINKKDLEAFARKAAKTLKTEKTSPTLER